MLVVPAGSKRSLGLIVLATIIAVCSLVIVLFYDEIYNSFTQSFVKKKSYAHIEYNSASKDVQLSRIKEFNEAVKGSSYAMNLAFKMKVFAIHGYNNIFQTAPGNDGVRMELVEPSSLGLVISNETRQRFTGLRISDAVVMGKQYFIQIVISKNKHVCVWMNGEKRIDTVVSAINPAVSEIAVGTGYSKSRRFDGVINDFNLKYSIYKKKNRLLSVLKAGGGAAVGILIAYPVFLFTFFQHNRQQSRIDHLQIPIWQIALSLSGFIVLLGFVIALSYSCWSGVSIQTGLLWFCMILAGLYAFLYHFGFWTGGLSKEEKLNNLSSLLIVGFVFAIVYHYWVGVYLGASFPLNTFVFRPMDRFMDYFNIFDSVKNLNPYYDKNGFFGNYFPFTYMIASTFTLFGKTLSFYIFEGLYVVFAILLYMYFLNENGRLTFSYRFLMTCIILLCTYPTLMELDRGNFESFVFIFMALFAVAYYQKKYWLGALFLAAATAMKGYPGAFIAVYLADRKYRELTLAVCIAIALSIIGMALLRGGLIHSFYGLRQGLKIFQSFYVAGMAGLAFNSSLYGILKHLGFVRGQAVKDYYIYFSILYYVAIVIYMFQGEKELWKRLALISSLCILLPQVSFNYKLILLYIPLLFYIIAENRSPLDYFYCFSFAILLIPKAYYCFFTGVSLGEILNPIAMYVVSAGIVLEGTLTRRRAQCLPVH